MKPCSRRPSRPALPLLLLALAGSACNDAPATSESGDTGTTDTESESGGEVIGWFEMGWGEGQYLPVASGDTLAIVRGGQGAEMFPLPFRGGEWFLPGDTVSWMDEDGPLIDLTMDIEGYNDGVGGHFKYIANYPLDWFVLDDGTYESSYLPVIVPDGIDTAELEGLPAHIEVKLRPHQQPTLSLELDVIVTVMSEAPPV